MESTESVSNEPELAELLFCNDGCRAKLEEAREYARSIGKLDHFERVLARLCHPTFFGCKARVRLFPDFTRHSFDFTIEALSKKTGQWVFAMNGGFIYHHSALEWSIHT